MKLSISTKNLAGLPAPLAEKIREWGARYRKRQFSVSYATKVNCREDARYTAFSADFSRAVSQKAAGEFAGMTPLSPTAVIEIPSGSTVVEEDIFLGCPSLTVFHNHTVTPTLNVTDQTLITR